MSVLYDAVDKHKQLILDAEQYIWKNPELGYKEFKTHAYLKERFEKLGYTLHEAGNIPGFYTDIDTGRKGPTIAVFGELDCLYIPTHPDCDKETGNVHACGHHCQTAALLGLAAALKEEKVLDNMCGKIRLIAVPAEEVVDTEYRRKLREQGIIKYFSGKVEFMYRGYLDGVDMAFMVHASSATNYDFYGNNGTNGCIVKKATFIGKAAHAGGSPHKGINALYAATTAINAANALRETFKDNDFIRFHPIITKGGNVVNAIPDEVVVESYVRGATLKVMLEANDKINRAFAGAAAAMGCKLIIEDGNTSAPRYNDINLQTAFNAVASEYFGKDRVSFGTGFGTGCSDLGDVSTVMPAIHPYCTGSRGNTHSVDFKVVDPVHACVDSAKMQLGALEYLLKDDAAFAKKVLKEKKTVYGSIAEYFAETDKINTRIDAVSYGDDGTVAIKYKN